MDDKCCQKKTHRSDDEKKVIINVKGMVCEGCEKRAQNALMQINGVTDVNADHNTGKVIVKSEKEIDKSAIKEKIEDLDFEVEE